MMNLRIPEDCLPLVQAAGWHANRRVALPEGFQAYAGDGHPAEGILASLGGLHVGSTGGGIECAKSDLDFKWVRDWAWLDHDIEDWNRLLHTRLVGIAEVHHAHGALCVASDGRCFGASGVHDVFYFEGESFGEALSGLLHGRRARPMLRPDQEVVTLYGIDYTSDSPELYRYDAT